LFFVFEVALFDTVEQESAANFANTHESKTVFAFFA